MVKNETGQIAIKHRRQTPKRVEVGKTVYIFTPKFNVSLAWINPEHVDQVLRIKRDCCGNGSRPIFTYAHQGDVNRWTTGVRG